MLYVAEGTGAYRRAAAQYWKAGWRGILPLPAGKKTPPPTGYTGEGGAWPSYADIHAWTEGNEGDGNIALRLPQHMIGVDVDHYDDKTGGDTFADAEHEYGTLPATWTTTSRTDGISGIRLYRIPEGLHWPGELGPDTELVQYKHRYAVVWPSVHPSGAQYAWYNPAGIRTTTPPAVDDLPDLPEAWVVALTGGYAASPTVRNEYLPVEAGRWLSSGQTPDVPCSRTAAALRRALDDLAAHGSRHASARDSTLRFARLAAEGHAGIPAAIRDYAPAFVTAATDPNRGAARSTGIAQTEFVSMLTGAVNLVSADTATPETADPCQYPFAGLLPATNPFTASGANTTTTLPITVDPLFAQELARERVRRAVRKALDDEENTANFRIPDWRPSMIAELALPEEPVNYVVSDLMPSGSNVLLTAQYKSGKTTMLNHLMRCLTDKEPFLGRYDVAALTGRVAIWNYEVDERQYRRWLRELNVANGEQATLLNLRGYRMPLLVPHVEEWAVRWLSDLGIQVWFIDPFARAFLGSGDNENDNTQVGEFLDTIDVIKERAGVSEVVLTSHTGRAEMAEGSERSRGATRLDDWADVRWLLTADETGNRFFRATGRDVEQPEGTLDYYGSVRGLFYRSGGRTEERGNRIAAVMIAAVEQQPGISYNALRSTVRERIDHASTALLDNVRKELLNTGRMLYISPTTTGQAGRHYPADASDLVTGGETRAAS